ncbi:EAL domain-containing protein [Vibrio hannami]|uniref:bifunctional diguanylate cyclase/phosphodiesterase n=1 Tax=Vibrio hannami TaxID=2717094 RepID=UPI00240EE9B3|nr:bifunctional diguanylate cyclase/phosphodiesterase [Vibrio hannami]MDG3085264.1 EAL domain-containing protein [Vibrio hannami]
MGSYTFLLYLKNENDKHIKIVRDILDTITDVIVIKDYDGNFVFCNDTVAKLYGSTPEDMVGKDDFYFTKNKEQADFFRENVRSIMRRFVKQEVYENSTDANTGEVRHFQSIKIPFRDSQNQLKIVVIAKDITDITRLKEEADRNKARLEHVLEVSQEGLWEWNTKTNQVLHNEQWETITGIKRSDNSFKEFEGCILEEDKPKVFQALDKLVKQNHPYDIEFRMKRPDGKIIWIWDRGQVAEYDHERNPLWLVGIAQDITSEKTNQIKINNLAYKDQLTGLMNRTQLEVKLREITDSNVCRNAFSAVLFLDLDRFKLLNDSYGHHMGDVLLKTVAERLKMIAQEKEIVSRFGGDEFVIILPCIDKKQTNAFRIAKQRADAIINEISDAFTLQSELQDIKIEYAITGSIGGVVFQSGKITAGKVLQLADTALYRTKAAGGHSSQIYDVSMHDDLRYTSELQKAMHHSIIERDFCIYLQPKYDISEKIVGAEALVRWNHPELGLLGPASFIDIAEESNMILPIGKIVLEQACQQLKLWQSDDSTKEFEISINLSAKQIWQNLFVDDFIDTVESYQIDHAKLVAEVTESVLIQDISDATEKLTKLREYGVSISLDDFGTGYSSLSYLRSLPIDEIKIDKSFIKDVTTNKQDLLMVKSIIELAENFEIDLVSEGVEREEQLELLKSLGVEKYQGFYFSKPLSTNAMKDLIASRCSNKNE